MLDMYNQLRVVIFILGAILKCNACQIQGSDTGICTRQYLPETYGTGLDGLRIAKRQWSNETVEGPCSDEKNMASHCMPFCGRYIANYYPPCIPFATYLEPDQNFPRGRHGSFTVLTKDKWVEETALKYISERIQKETNETAKKLGVDEYGVKGKRTPIRFYRNSACQEAYKKFICWLNFPRCDDEYEESLPMCQSACLNFFRVCGFEKETWRCDTPQDTEKKPGVHHNFFPGQPFKENEYLPKSGGEPKIVCTPSIKGSAPLAFNGRHHALIIISSVTLLFVTF